jgi:hypothetical protein
MTLHLFPAQAVLVDFFLQLFIVANMLVSVDVLQPAKTFSSGVPLPRTINWGWIHFFRSSMFPPLCSWHPFHKDTYIFYNKSFCAGVNRIV